MCLVALAIGCDPRFPLVVAANRDEYFARPTAPLGWWSLPSCPPVLGGRDLLAGGTWLGVTAAGRLALLTNVRAPDRNDPAALTRGRLVTDWLCVEDDGPAFVDRFAGRHHNGFNLVAADFRRGDCFWFSNVAGAGSALGAGLYGLANAALDTPWPKVLALKGRVGDALSGSASTAELEARLFAALADREPSSDAALPRTGLSLEDERALSSAFVALPERGYGTRSSTLLVSCRAGNQTRTVMVERTFGADTGAAFVERRVVLEGWRGP